MLVTVSSQTRTFYLPGKLFKTQIKQLNIASGSPWNSGESLGPSYTEWRIKTAESLSEKSQGAKTEDSEISPAV